MTEIEVPGPGPDWQPATQPPYYTGKNPASQYSIWEHSAPLFQMIGVLALPVQPVALRLRLHVERSWDGLDDLDVVLFRLKGFSFAISNHDGNPLDVSHVWLTQPHEQADKALDTLLEVVGIGEEAVASRVEPREDPTEQTATARAVGGSPDGVSGTALPTSLWARFRRAICTTHPPRSHPRISTW
ncbi:hypothetical protein [Streptomyces tauricus]|uniref:hypothetical protein n=1 Tax=Streptomyces tauricus TaxID=68274 RepID=UPI0022433AC9|nr:hypothetical protein [Streptomyces tauricus]MCW8101661.1 hypothetical protein [Streptomyces tauricus]